ncbi:NAD(P)-dependent oxidoreductase [Bailinhaonella thermotolerans]|uniref:NAD(P)-dependent oxidoreductase n=1 Tax=Bailinhaonella thermotolerans TaxID=1070861 RepID=A0A3A4BD27_9ACTN|nr:NAD(P)-dependent oxidoreductase [Bailinhaonella thermotolerans]RJL32108.1 NAD(P)-dependent oxidoreductase [Bailinhaonella thermotolerans]
MATVGFIGLGAMGGRMARRLLDAGHSLTVWNRTPEKAEPLVRAGAIATDSPRAAATGAELVITMLATPEALREVTEGPEGVAAGVCQGAVVAEMSTVGAEAVERLVTALPEGVGLVDAPVLGSLPEAEAGTLKIFLGGPKDLADRVTPTLSALGTPLHLGPRGSGAAAKLVANSTLFGVLGVLGEALALSDALGLSREAAFQVLGATPLAAQAERRRPAVESGDYPHHFALSLARKDATLVTAAAERAGLHLRLAPAARSWLADADAAGWSDRDYSAILAYILSTPTRPTPS